MDRFEQIIAIRRALRDANKFSEIKKEGFPIPSPDKNEAKDVYIARCNAAISDEYGYEQANAICYDNWDKK
jgi:hypothetical protein